MAIKTDPFLGLKYGDDKGAYSEVKKLPEFAGAIDV